MNAPLGACAYCGQIAAVAINCPCGHRIAYCGECRELGAIAIADHAVDCDRAGRAFQADPLADRRLAELLLERASVEVLPAPRRRHVAGGLVLEVGP